MDRPVGSGRSQSIISVVVAGTPPPPHRASRLAPLRWCPAAPPAGRPSGAPSVPTYYAGELRDGVGSELAGHQAGHKPRGQAHRRASVRTAAPMIPAPVSAWPNSATLDSPARSSTRMSASALGPPTAMCPSARLPACPHRGGRQPRTTPDSPQPIRRLLFIWHSPARHRVVTAPAYGPRRCRLRALEAATNPTPMPEETSVSDRLCRRPRRRAGWSRAPPTKATMARRSRCRVG